MISGEPPRPGVYVATGPRNLPSWFLHALCPALARGAQVFWIDAANAFDAYGAGYAARGLGFDPRPVLSHVHLARPFNAFQLETIVRTKVPALWRQEPIVLADPFPMLYDEDLPEPEARRIVGSVLSAMRALPAIWMVLAVDHEAPAGRRDWLPRWMHQAAACASLTHVGPQWQLQEATA
jgi:hypothetical protein